MSQLILPYLEALLLKIIMLIFYKDKKIYGVVKKNMDGHQRRNSKTSLMFTIALAFLIFAGCSFELEGNIIIMQIRSLAGSDLLVNAITSPNLKLKEKSMREYLDKLMNQTDPLVAGYSFITPRLDLDVRVPKSQISQKSEFSTPSGILVF